LAQSKEVIMSLSLLAFNARERRSIVRGNDIIPFIIVIAIVVLLALAVTVVAAAIIVCAVNHGVFDTVASIKNGYVTIKCHKL
jgi:uncharacterized RDD family membrane protein YckC